MAALTESEKHFIARALVNEISDTPGEWAIPALAIAAEIGAKLELTEQLRVAACLFEAEKSKIAVS